MNEHLNDLALKALAGVLVVAGLICVLVGYLGVRRSSDIVLQLPYFASGGIGGLALIALGALALVQQQMREQSRRAGEVTEALDEWKEAALSEIRAFLEGATLEVEVLAPKTRQRRTPTADLARASG